MCSAGGRERDRMPRFAFISDIHSNLQALEAVLADIEDRHDLEAILCLGDIVGYGPNPQECLDLVQSRCSLTIQGNHDLAVVDDDEADRFNDAAWEGIRYSRVNLSVEARDWLAALPEGWRLDDVTLAHGSPNPDSPCDYIHDQMIAAASFAGFDNTCLLVGHTHVPIAFAAPDMGYAPIEPNDVRICLLPSATPLYLDPDERYILNPGSVGQPRDGDPDASYGILDIEERTFTVYRVPYDIAAAQRAFREAGLPDFLAQRLRLGA